MSTGKLYHCTEEKHRVEKHNALNLKFKFNFVEIKASQALAM